MPTAKVATELAAEDVVARGELFLELGCVLAAWPCPANLKDAKKSLLTGWHENPIRTVEQLEHAVHQGHTQLGLNHGHSRTAALDIDDADGAAIILDYLGLDFAELCEQTLCIVSPRGGMKPIFRVPDGVTLDLHAVTWQKKTILEFRASRPNKGRQDVLPPSLHPSGKRYKLHNAEKGIQPLPAQLLDIWRNFADYEPALVALDPTAPLQQPRQVRKGKASTPSADSVIEAYNGAHSLPEVLEQYGYKQAGHRRYTKPDGKHDGGIVLFDSPQRGWVAFVHHAGHELAQQTADAFAFFCLHEHSNDKAKATRAAAELLGIAHEAHTRPAKPTNKPQDNDDNADADTWPDILPPPEQQPWLAPELDPELLPDKHGARRYVVNAAAQIKDAPLQMVACSLLVGLSTVVANKVRVKVASKHEKHLIPPNLWGAVCAHSSAAKTPCIKAGLAPLLALDSYHAQRTAETAQQLAVDIRSAQANARAAEKALDRAAEKNDSSEQAEAEQRLLQAQMQLTELAEQLHARCYLVNDVTPQRLVEMFAEQNYARLIFRDELAGLLMQFDESHFTGSKQLFLEAWNGWGRYTVRRKIGDIHAEQLTLSLVGGITPEGLQEYVSQRGNSADGFLQRVQLFVLSSNKPRQRQDLPTDTEAENAIMKLFADLDKATPEQLRTAKTPLGRDVVTLTADATRAALDVLTTLDSAVAQLAATQEDLESHLVKYEALLYKLAYLLHLLNGGLGKPIDVESIELAAAWLAYLEPHAMRLYGVSEAEDKLVAKLDKLIADGVVHDGMKFSQAYRKLKANTPREQLEPAFATLAARNILRIETVHTGKRPSEVLRLHPELRQGS